MGINVASNMAEVIRRLEQIGPRVDKAAGAAVVKVGFLLEAEIKKQLTTSSHKKGTPTPSAPGQPPSLVTGTLRRSIQTEIYRTAAATGARIGPTVIYGRIQELGGTAGRGSRLTPRPYVRPALDTALRSGQLEAVFVRSIADALN